MKNHILALVLLFIPLLQYAQNDTIPFVPLLTIEATRDIIQEHRDSLQVEIKDSSRLVTENTFRELVKKDFSILTSGTDGNFSTVGRFASLKVDQDKLKFSLTPITTTFAKKEKSNLGLFRNIFSLDISGSVNTNSRFTWKDRKKVTIGISYINIHEGYKFKTGTKPDEKIYEKVYEGLQNKLIIKYRKSTSNALDSLDSSKTYKNSESLRKEFKDQVATYENKLVAGKWTTKKLWWGKLNVDFLSWDFVNYLSNTEINAGSEPKTKAYYSPSIYGTYNFYGGSDKGQQVYLSGGIGIERKNSLTELNQTSVWNKVNEISDSIQTIKDTKEIFLTDFEEIEIEWLPNFNAQVIGLFRIKEIDLGFLKFENINVGTELSISHHLLVKPISITEEGGSSLTKLLFGIIFPMKDKKGKASVIIEPFIERKFFKNYLEESNNIVGVKFSLPFTQLY